MYIFYKQKSSSFSTELLFNMKITNYRQEVAVETETTGESFMMAVNSA